MFQKTANGQEYVSVVIVGAGPTGLTMGNLLGMLGIDALILERNSGPSDCPKAIALDDEILRICQAMDLLNPVLKDVLLDIDAHYVSSGRFLARVSPTSKRNGHPLISTFHQPRFEETLLAGLKRFECISVRFKHTVEAFEQTADSLVISIRTPEGTLSKVECAYLLACDGGRSSIRHGLGIPMKGSSFAQKWLVIDTIHDKDPSTVATFFCNPRRPTVCVPAPHQGRRWEFMLLPGEKEEDMLREEKIRTLIQQVGGPSHPKIIRQTCYTFHAVLAETFSNGHVFLLGDAAHLMPPFGGQGMNSGLRDAHNLSWKLHLVLRGLASSTLLDTYGQERHEHAAQMIKLSTFLGSIVMPTSRLVALFRDGALLTLNTIPTIREYFAEARMKPQPRYKRGFLLSDRSRESRRITGVMLPQPEVVTQEGKRMLLDEVLGTGFALLRLSDTPEKAFVAIKGEVWKRLGVQFVCVQPGEQVPVARNTCVVVGDIQQHMTAFLLHNQNIFVVVRPDRYVFGVFREEEAEQFATAFQELLQGVESPTAINSRK
jgi:3-(3-hydroxy-phenyl)propionate hydroxylase